MVTSPRVPASGHTAYWQLKRYLRARMLDPGPGAQEDQCPRLETGLSRDDFLNVLSAERAESREGGRVSPGEREREGGPGESRVLSRRESRVVRRRESV